MRLARAAQHRARRRRRGPELERRRHPDVERTGQVHAAGGEPGDRVAGRDCSPDVDHGGRVAGSSTKRCSASTPPARSAPSLRVRGARQPGLAPPARPRMTPGGARAARTQPGRDSEVAGDRSEVQAVALASGTSGRRLMQVRAAAEGLRALPGPGDASGGLACRPPGPSASCRRRPCVPNVAVRPAPASSHQPGAARPGLPRAGR